MVMISRQSPVFSAVRTPPSSSLSCITPSLCPPSTRNSPRHQPSSRSWTRSPSRILLSSSLFLSAMQSEIVPRGDGSSGEGSSASPGSPEETPFLRRVPSESRRRRVVSEPTLSSLSSPFAFESNSRRRSFRRDVGHAAAETFLLTRLTLILLRYLGYFLSGFFLLWLFLFLQIFFLMIF